MTHLQVNNNAAVSADGARWTSRGASAAGDPFDAAAEAAVAAAGPADAALYLVAASRCADFEAAAAGVASRAPHGATVVGCASNDQLGADAGLADAVSVFALGGPGLSVATRWVDVVGGDYRTAGEQAAAAAWDVDDQASTVLILLTDRPDGDCADLVNGARATTGPTIPVVACHSGEAAGGSAALVHATSAGGWVGSGRVIAVAISSPVEFGSDVTVGWSAVVDTFGSLGS